MRSLDQNASPASGYLDAVNSELDYAVYDDSDHLWRCGKCACPLNADGDCPDCDDVEPSGAMRGDRP